MPDLWNYLIVGVWPVAFTVAIFPPEGRRMFAAIVALVLSGVILFTSRVSAYPIFAPRQLVQAIVVIAPLIATAHAAFPEIRTARGFWLAWALAAVLVLWFSTAVPW